MKVGEVINNYRITDKIGVGGMGVVYLAEHTLIGRKAAIKVLLPEFCNKPQVVNRFFNEARAATAIQSQGIVEVFDSGYHDDNTAYIIMEYLHGESLKQRLKRLGRLTEPQALGIIRQVAVALAAAHHKGIIHRDLKPDNIFLVPDREVPGGERIKILDFGIAKLLTNAIPNVHATSTRVMLGTPTYMSPEQVRADANIDQRADLYALGCILFKLLAGRPPFVSDGSGELVAQHLYAHPPSLRTFVPALSARTEDLVSRLLAKDPDDRFPSSENLISAIDSIMQGVPGDEATPSARPSMAHDIPVSMDRTPASLSDASVNPPITMGSGIAPTMGSGIGPSMGSGISSNPMVSLPGTHAGQEEKSNLGLWLVLLLVLVVGGTLIASTQLRGGSPSSPTVDLVIESTPSGAEVYQMPTGNRVGVTPFRSKAPRANGELVFILKLAGHEDAMVSLPANSGGTKAVEMKTAGSGGGGSGDK